MGIKSEMLYKVHEGKSPNTVEMIKGNKIDLVINIPHVPEPEEHKEDRYLIRRTASDMAVPLVTNPQLAKLIIESLSRKKLGDLKIKAWDEYNGI